ncbi:MAG TPA: 50S ribosomal protein L30 [Candidatus Aenigmarchaeota archaeon]|nr:MAG: 50S ribosomal protein L30 [Candidatus Aenigmarchaeota archaeon]HDD46222.1 50S ribosomal protein L30 [Candidatus Aenigmarchaeota archaeon]
MYAAIRIRGRVDVRREIEDTMNMLMLKRRNHCVLLPKNKSIEGMLKKVKDYVTWGELDKETIKAVLKSRGRMIGNKKLTEEKIEEIIKALENGKSVRSVSGVKPVLRLNSPRKGFKSIKLAFPKGDLGYRGEKIKELILRMI